MDHIDFKGRDYFRILNAKILANIYTDFSNEVKEILAPKPPYFYILCKNKAAEEEYLLNIKDLSSMINLESTTFGMHHYNSYGCIAINNDATNNNIDIHQIYRDGSWMYLNTSMFFNALKILEESHNEQDHSRFPHKLPFPLLSTFSMSLDCIRLINSLYECVNTKNEQYKLIVNSNSINDNLFLKYDIIMGLEFGVQKAYGLWKPRLKSGMRWNGYYQWFGPLSFYENNTRIEYTIPYDNLNIIAANNDFENRMITISEVIRPFFDNLVKMAIPNIKLDDVIYHAV